MTVLVDTPTRSETRQRNTMVSVRLLPEEREQVGKLASAWDCSIAEVVRRALLRELRLDPR